MSPTKKDPAALGFDPELLPLLGPDCAPGDAKPLVDADGQALDAVVLHRGESRELTLYVKSPPGTLPLPLEVEVQAAAEEDASARQQLSATVFTNVEAKVRLTALNATEPILPRGNATFDLLVENIGDVDTPITYSTTGLLPPGWNLSFVDAPPLLLAQGKVDAFGNALNASVFQVNVTAGPDAPVGEVVPVNVVATSAIIIDSGDTAQAFKQSDSAKITAAVGNNFTLDQPEALPLTIDPGQPFPLDFDVRNVANGNFTLRVLPGALPRNWTLDISSPVNATSLGIGDRVSVRANVTPQVATKAGAYDLGLAYVTQDAHAQGVQFRNVTILVRSAVDFDVQPEVGSLVLAPGAEREVALRVVNTGNLPVALHLAAAPPAGYQATFLNGSKASLDPGGVANLTLDLRAPPQPAETPQPLRITATDDTSGKAQDFPLQVATARVDLVVVEATLATKNLQPGQTALVAAVVQNRGTYPANDVSIALLADGRGVLNTTLRTLPPGDPRTITLPWTVDQVPHTLEVVLDPDNRFVQSDTSGRVARIDVGKGLPGFEGGFLLAGLAVAAVVARAKPKAPGRGGGP
jgi:uncharacterized membrane protein